MKRMTPAEIAAACDAFEASTDFKDPTYRRRRTMTVNLSKDPWPKVSVRDQITAILTK
ncbi:hypothetical protein [Brevundimonas sp. TWP2-1]|uniref:hypothetical protein n=2 Tax=unclassified Brevundimonas TaxID=2622653 RepID=UPI003CF07B6F